jgi:hypothetical protein
MSGESVNKKTLSGNKNGGSNGIPKFEDSPLSKELAEKESKPSRHRLRDDVLDSASQAKVDLEEWIKKETESKSAPAMKTKTKAKAKAKASSSALPEEPAAASKTPKVERSKEDYPSAGDGIFTDPDEDGEDDFSEEGPSAPKLVERLPKAKYIRLRPGAENMTAFYAIKLDQEDQRPGEMGSYILTKEMRDYFDVHLSYKVTKMFVVDGITIQGDRFIYMFPASSELSGNSWVVSRRAMIAAAMKGWIIVRTDLKAHEYKWRTRKANLSPVEFPWEEEPIRNRVLKAIDGPRLIQSTDHPVVKRLEGIVDEGDEN